MSAGIVVFSRLADATSAERRIYPLVFPQNGTYPAIRYQQISETRTHALGGDIPITRVRMQIDGWTGTYAESAGLAAQIQARLSRFHGTVEGIEVLDCLLDTVTHEYESEAQQYRVSLDFSIFLKMS